MRRVLILALPLFALALSACGNMGGHRADVNPEAQAAIDARLANQEANLARQEASLAKLANAVERLADVQAATPPLPEPELPDGNEDTGHVGEGETDADGSGDGAPEAVVVTTVEDTVPVETVAMPLADNSGADTGANVVSSGMDPAAREQFELYMLCTERNMRVSADVGKSVDPTAAAYPCSHGLGLNHSRRLENADKLSELKQRQGGFTPVNLEYGPASPGILDAGALLPASTLSAGND